MWNRLNAVCRLIGLLVNFTLYTVMTIATIAFTYYLAWAVATAQNGLYKDYFWHAWAVVFICFGIPCLHRLGLFVLLSNFLSQKAYEEDRK